MAGLWCDPFDQYPNVASMLDGVYANVGSHLSISTTNPATGAKNLRLTPISIDVGGTINSDLSFRRVFPDVETVAAIAYHLYVPTLPSTESVQGENSTEALILGCFLDGAGNGQVQIVLGTDGSIVAYRGANFIISIFDYNNTTFLGRSGPCVTAKSYNHVEMRVFIHPTDGTIEVRVNGVTELNLAGLNTDWSGAGNTSQVFVGMIENVTHQTLAYVDYDDLHAWNDVTGVGPSDFVGNASVYFRPPVADTAMADWALTGGGVGYPLLADENDATFISAATLGLNSAFTFEALPSGVAGVVYQQLTWRGLKSDAGDGSVAPFFVSDAVQEDGPSFPMTTAEAWRWWIDAQDPGSSGAPWTPASANACEGGFNRSA